MLAQLIANTPVWVPIILLVLIIYGGILTRNRSLNATKVLMLPIIMVSLSVAGVFSSFGVRPAAMIAWAIGFALAISLNRLIRGPGGVTYDPATARFHVPGSWWPLVLMMAIFFAKYVVGATTAMQPAVAASREFGAALSFLFGLCSGAFFARFLQIWSAKAASPSVARGAVDPLLGGIR